MAYKVILWLIKGYRKFSASQVRQGMFSMAKIRIHCATYLRNRRFLRVLS